MMIPDSSTPGPAPFCDTSIAPQHSTRRTPPPNAHAVPQDVSHIYVFACMCGLSASHRQNI